MYHAGRVGLMGKGRSIFPYGFLNSNNVKIQVAGWVRINGLYGFICRYVKIGGWVGGSKPIRTLFEFRNPYGKVDLP